MFMECVIEGRNMSYYAEADFINGKMLIKKGSRICMKTANFAMAKEAKEFRSNTDILEEHGVLKEDIILSSPSTAAQFVTGNSTNGLRQWKEKKTRKSINQIIATMS